MVTGIIITGAAGRMGKMLTEIAINSSDYELQGLVEKNKDAALRVASNCFVSESLEEVVEKCPDAVIVDFTSPQGTLEHAEIAAKNKNPLVIGTTGLTVKEMEQLNEFATKTPLFWAPNMSVGINVLLQTIPELVKKLGTGYDIEISEIHHNKKVDAPSGTALKLADSLANARNLDYETVKKHCRDGIVGARTKDEIGVQTIRGGDVVGDHTIYFLGTGERLEITHRAHSRETFAVGALRAAAWLRGKPAGRLYGMMDMLG